MLTTGAGLYRGEGQHGEQSMFTRIRMAWAALIGSSIVHTIIRELKELNMALIDDINALTVSAALARVNKLQAQVDAATAAVAVAKANGAQALIDQANADRDAALARVNELQAQVDAATAAVAAEQAKLAG
jgi:hypothetical protein